MDSQQPHPNSNGKTVPSQEGEAAYLGKITSVAPSVIYVFNQKTQSNEYVNQTMGVLTGYTEQEVQQMGDQFMPKNLHPDDLPTVGAHFQKIKNLKDGEHVSVEYRLRHKNGHWAWLLSFDTVFDRDENGDVLRHIGSASDISEQKIAEQKAQYERDRTANTYDELRGFSHALSHGLKAPSDKVAEVLDQITSPSSADDLDQEGVELVEQAKATVLQLQHLLDDVLEYTDVMNAPYEPSLVDLTEIVRDVLGQLDGEIRQSGAQVEQCDLPEITGSPTLLRVLMLNLLDNAVKFSASRAQPMIRLGAQTDEANRTLTISVEDNGIGINSEHLAKIFDIFNRLHPRVSYPGTGLGLASCQRIVDAHGGKISVQSREGEGTCFTVELPLG